jgi:hypothetical protein
MEINDADKKISFSSMTFKKALKKLRPEKPISLKERSAIYRKHFQQKYGKDLSNLHLFRRP